MATPEQIIANQANSLKSSGPSSVLGKAASSKNALKHGLTGAGVVMLAEDAARMDERMPMWVESLAPIGDIPHR